MIRTFPITWYMCKQCRATFSTREKLIFHKQQTHKVKVQQTENSATTTEENTSKEVIPNNLNGKSYRFIQMAIHIKLIDDIELEILRQQYPNLRINLGVSNTGGSNNDNVDRNDIAEDVETNLQPKTFVPVVERRKKRVVKPKKRKSRKKQTLRKSCNPNPKTVAGRRNVNLQVAINDRDTEKAFIGDICLNQFSTPHVLAKLKKINTGDKPYGCAYCDGRFLRMSNLKVHENKYHGKKITKCNRRKQIRPNVRAANVVKQQKICHPQKLLVECMFCKKSFRDSYDLKRHEWTHTGISPYKCNICVKYFSRPSLLKRHQELVHDQPVQMPVLEPMQ